MRVGVSSRETVETIDYDPGLKDTGDLEGGTNTITATSEATGVGNADYTHSLTLEKPADARLLVKRIAARLAVTIDSMTANHVYCRVYVDQQDAGHRLFDDDWEAAGERLDADTVHADSKATIFNLLKDGASHTFYFFFWVDTGNAVISCVQLCEGIGTSSTDSIGAPDTLVMTLEHTGLTCVTGYLRRVGSGDATMRLYGVLDDHASRAMLLKRSGGDYSSWENPPPVVLHGSAAFRLNTSVATDIACYGGVLIRMVH